MKFHFFYFLFSKKKLKVLGKCTINGREFGLTESDSEIPKKWLHEGCLVKIPDSLTVLFLKVPSFSNKLNMWSYRLSHIDDPLPAIELITKEEPVHIARFTYHLSSFCISYQKTIIIKYF